MSEREKLIHTTKVEIRSVLLSARNGIEFARFNSDYRTFTGHSIPYRDMGYVNLEAFIDNIPDVIDQFVDYSGTRILKGVADASTQHIAQLVALQKTQKRKSKKPFTGPRLGLLANSRLRSTRFVARSPPHHHPFAKQQRSPPRFQRFSAKPTHSVQRLPSELAGGRPLTGMNRPTIGNRGNATVAPPPTIHTGDRGNVRPIIGNRGNPTGGSCGNVAGSESVNADHGNSGNRGNSCELYSRGGRLRRSFAGKPELQAMMSSYFKQHGRSRLMWLSMRRSICDEFGIDLELHDLGFSDPAELFAYLDVPVKVKKLDDGDYVVVPELVEKRSVNETQGDRQRSSQTSSINTRPAVSNASSGPRQASNTSSSSFSSKTAAASSERSTKPTETAAIASCKQEPTTEDFTLKKSSQVNDAETRKTAADEQRQKRERNDAKEAVKRVLRVHPNGLTWTDLREEIQTMTGSEVDYRAMGYPSIERMIMDFNVRMIYNKERKQLLLHLKSLEEISFDLPLPDPALPISARSTEFPEDSVGPEHVIVTQRLPVGVDESLSIYITNVINPGNFCFQIDGRTYEKLVEIIEALQSTYEHPTGDQYSMPQSLLRPGQLCAAKFPEDNLWYRGSISGIVDSSAVQVYYLDYGSNCSVPVTRIRILRSRYLSLPAQAIRATLSKVQPVNGVWSQNAYNYFMSLTNNRRLTATINCLNGDGLVSLSLFDQNDGKDIDLSEYLVREGFAKFENDEQERAFKLAACVEPEIAQEKTRVAQEKTHIAQEKTRVDSFAEKLPPAVEKNEREFESPSGIAVRFVQLTAAYSCHLVRINGKLYINSADVSAFIFEEDLIRMMLRNKGYAYLPKLVLSQEDHADTIKELSLFGIPGIVSDKQILVLYDVATTIYILEIFHHKSSELSDALNVQLEQYERDPSRWKGNKKPSKTGVQGASTYGVEIEKSYDDETEKNDKQDVETSISQQMEHIEKLWKVLHKERQELVERLCEKQDAEESRQLVAEIGEKEAVLKKLEEHYNNIQGEKGAALGGGKGPALDEGMALPTEETAPVKAAIGQIKTELRSRGIDSDLSSAERATASPAPAPSTADDRKLRTNAVAPMAATSTAPPPPSASCGPSAQPESHHCGGGIGGPAPGLPRPTVHPQSAQHPFVPNTHLESWLAQMGLGTHAVLPGLSLLHGLYPQFSYPQQQAAANFRLPMMGTAVTMQAPTGVGGGGHVPTLLGYAPEAPQNLGIGFQQQNQWQNLMALHSFNNSLPSMPAALAGGASAPSMAAYGSSLLGIANIDRLAAQMSQRSNAPAPSCNQDK